jgi:hypothetical protein
MVIAPPCRVGALGVLGVHEHLGGDATTTNRARL